MNCCTGCFLDVELKGFINYNSNENGNCDFCNNHDKPLVNVLELEAMLITVLDIYQIDNDEGTPIDKALQDDWSIFNLASNTNVSKLVGSICEGLDEEYQELLVNQVKMKVLDETKELLENWESFKEEIKRENRFFFNNKANLQTIENILPIRGYSKGKIFYRSRISSSEFGHRVDEMGKPPNNLSKSGRANPKGIPYLYLAQSIQTTMYEARATFLDYVSIGQFMLDESINIISLRTSYQVSPWTDFSLEDYIKYKPLLDRFENDLAKPLRRQDNELDYLPTQYLCEYFKSLGYDGVEYGSSLHEGGINLVVFNDEKLTCKSVEVHEVSKIEILSEAL